MQTYQTNLLVVHEKWLERTFLKTLLSVVVPSYQKGDSIRGINVSCEVVVEKLVTST